MIHQGDNEIASKFPHGKFQLWDIQLPGTAQLTYSYRAESKTGQSYYGPKARKPHDSYGFLHYGKNCNDITYLL